MDKKPVDKVYINMRKLIADNSREGATMSKQPISEFCIKKGTKKSKWTMFLRKTHEDSIYELTFTEAYNLALYFDIPMGEFVDKYCKAL